VKQSVRANAGSCLNGAVDIPATLRQPVAPALIAAGHFGRGMAELLLDIALIDLSREGEAGAQRMPGKHLAELRLVKRTATHVDGEGGPLDEACDLLIV